jgi:hypothetical protein
MPPPLYTAELPLIVQLEAVSEAPTTTLNMPPPLE